MSPKTNRLIYLTITLGLISLAITGYVFKDVVFDQHWGLKKIQRETLIGEWIHKCGSYVATLVFNDNGTYSLTQSEQPQIQFGNGGAPVPALMIVAKEGNWELNSGELSLSFVSHEEGASVSFRISKRSENSIVLEFGDSPELLFDRNSR